MADRICRRCHYFFEEDRVLELRPPRAADRHAARPWAKGSAFRLWWGERRMRPPRWQTLALAGLVPGLGHVLSHDSRRGVIFFAAVAGGLAASSVMFRSIFGQALFGLAMGAHAYSIWELTPMRTLGSAPVRMAGVIAIQGVLAVLYWPLMTYLADLFIPAMRVAPRNRDLVLTGLAVSGAVIALLAVGGVRKVIETLRRSARP
jgi:hypothetical protein